MRQNPDRRRVLATLAGGVAAAVAGGTAGAADAAAGCAVPGSAAMTHEVAIKDFAFVPEALAVRPGDTIRWTNTDLSPHTATAEDGSWDTGEIGEGQSATLVVTENMAPTYHCLFHTQMLAKLSLCRV